LAFFLLDVLSQQSGNELVTTAQASGVVAGGMGTFPPFFLNFTLSAVLLLVEKNPSKYTNCGAKKIFHCGQI